MNYFFLFILSLISLDTLSKAYVRFSPDEGKFAFQDIFERIDSASNSIDMTLYSWSHPSLMPHLKNALQRNIQLRMVLHPKLAKKEKIKENIMILNEMGAKIKISPKDMHEKMLLIDDRFLLNTSANFSMGAQNKYSENFIFHINEGEPQIQSLIRQFQNEFEILWNYARESAKGELYRDSTSEIRTFNKEFLEQDNILFSSSENYNQTIMAKAIKGSKLKLKIKNKQSWVVRDEIIRQIQRAQVSIDLNLNHFFIKEIADALIQVASNKNIKVRLMADNQEFNLSPQAREITPYFATQWKKEFPLREIPIRIKFYSLRPSYRFWHLNHHKYIIIDRDSDAPVLINGSYNFSKKAEQGQFDNMVVYQNQLYKKVIQRFSQEFNKLWFQNRNDKDRPTQEILNYFQHSVEGFYPIHSPVPMAMKWDELITWFKFYKAKLNIHSIPIFSNHKHCTNYNPITREVSGCPF